MTVYQRTPEGKWAAYNAESPLPRKLKILLKAINGTVTEDVYATNLSAFGDVRELLRSLAQAGLIEDANQRASHAVANPAAIMVKLEQLVRRFSQPHKDDPVSSRVPPHAAMPAPEPVFFPLPLPLPLPLPMVVEPDIELPIGEVIGAEVGDPSVVERVLHQAIEAMASFVLSHLPGSAFQLLPEIEALSTLDQLVVLMDGYAQFAADAGEPGRAHLAQLNRLLAEGRGTADFNHAVLTP
jgi:hypothetical protein